MRPFKGDQRKNSREKTEISLPMKSHSLYRVFLSPLDKGERSIPKRRQKEKNKQITA
jgi:hypothetical protein